MVGQTELTMARNGHGDEKGGDQSMWQLEWASEPVDASRGRLDGDVRRRDAGARAEIARVGGLMWEEHCHECAAPDCYQTCPLYVRRADGQCARFEYGIYRNPMFAGLYPFGADVRFRRWAKLESVIPVGQFPTWTASTLAGLDRVLAAQARRVDEARRGPIRRRITSAYRKARLASLRAFPTRDFDDFVIEAWSPEEREFRLAVECKHEGTSYFRESVLIRPGWNRFSLPAAALLSGATGSESRLLIYPEADATVRIIFTWLDFVRYQRRQAAVRQPSGTLASESTASPGGGATVKCVVWDLDGTLWDGILADVGPDAVTPTAAVRELIEQLDARGIVQSIASKNDFDDAWSVLKKVGLDRMFLYPSIHWGPKSESIRHIAKSLNIGLDSMAFIDDSAVERAQVKDAVPEIRVYQIEDIPRLMTFREFDVEPTEEGRRRRLSYLSEMERQKTLSASPDMSIEQFLRSCSISVSMFVPSEDWALDRCHELLLRSNQLNLSTRRYTRDELAALIVDPRCAPIAISVSDRYGDYGLVGFMSLRLDPNGDVRAHDLVLSCRVAKKRVENAVLEAIRRMCRETSPRVRMRFIPSERNAPLLDALTGAGVTQAAIDADGALLLELDTRHPVPLSDVVSAVDIDPAVDGRVHAMSVDPAGAARPVLISVGSSAPRDVQA